MGASISVGLLALLGCGAPPPTGTFRGGHRLAVQPGTDPVVAAQLQRVTLRIEPDGRAKLEDAGVPWEGRVTRSGDGLTFEVLTIAGINIEKQPAELARTLKFRLFPNGDLGFADAILTKH